ncbi:hypothetical protein [Tabrizicola sp.]|jgi:hypothetical protein
MLQRKKIAAMRRPLWRFLRQPPDFAVFSGFCKFFATKVFFALAAPVLPP